MTAALKLKSLNFVLTVPIYEQNVLFVLGYDKQKASEIVAMYGGSDEFVEFVRTLKTSAGVCTQDGETGKFLIYMDELPRRSSQHGTLIHELFHLTEQIMDRVGMKHKPYVSSEAYAYLLGRLTKDTLDVLWTATNTN